MGRMQVLGLGLGLVLSWAGWASSAPVDPTKIEGRWKHIFTASDELEGLSHDDILQLHPPYLQCFSQNCEAISLGFTSSYRGYCCCMMHSMKRQFDCIHPTWEPTESSWVSLNSMDEGNVLPPNILDLVQVSDSLLLLRFVNQGLGSSSGDTYTIMALGREPSLSEADMADFQKVLGDTGIVAEPLDIICADVCIDVFLSKK